ncbi:MAG TPA: YraN family protein [Gammaproteobacteria bacterium]|nr:YraN family protein [Gammaproteobacteria bacterium]
MFRGASAERLALKFLRRQGLAHIASNYRSRFGEIDLIMRDGETIVFVEVRYRRSSRYGGAAASIDRHKQRKLIRTALLWLQAHAPNAVSRFDVVAIEAEQRINWIPRAFTA